MAGEHRISPKARRLTSTRRKPSGLATAKPNKGREPPSHPERISRPGFACGTLDAQKFPQKFFCLKKWSLPKTRALPAQMLCSLAVGLLTEASGFGKSRDEAAASCRKKAQFSRHAAVRGGLKSQEPTFFQEYGTRFFPRLGDECYKPCAPAGFRNSRPTVEPWLAC